MLLAEAVATRAERRRWVAPRRTTSSPGRAQPQPTRPAAARRAAGRPRRAPHTSTPPRVDEAARPRRGGTSGAVRRPCAGPDRSPRRDTPRGPDDHRAAPRRRRAGRRAGRCCSAARSAPRRRCGTRRCRRWRSGSGSCASTTAGTAARRCRRPGPTRSTTSAGDVLALLDDLERRSGSSYAGLSLGGMVGMWLAAHAPERVDRLALLLHVGAAPAPARLWPSGPPRCARQGTRAAIAEAVVARWLTPAFAARAPRRRRALTPRCSARRRPEGYAACCEVDRRDGPARRPGPRSPRRRWSIAGADDPATPRRARRRDRSPASPAPRLVVVDPAAHLANVEQPDAVTALLLEHLDAADAERRSPLVSDDHAAPRAGMQVRREVLGDAHVDRAVAGTTPFTADFQDFITRYAWGDVWTRRGLDRRTRSVHHAGRAARRAAGTRRSSACTCAPRCATA